MNRFQVLSDLGRIPGKIDCGEGFSNFTADQWQIFFTIYATVSLWEYLLKKDQKILNHFVRVCSILVSQIIESNLMNEAQRRLIKILKLIEEHYGRNKITPNFHLHVEWPDIAMDAVTFLAVGGLWLWNFFRKLGQRALLPVNDPQFEHMLEAKHG